MSDYYDPDTDYDKGAREFGERPLITDDRGGSELVPEKDLPNALFRAGGVDFVPEVDLEGLEADYMQTLVQYAEIFDEVFGSLLPMSDDDFSRPDYEKPARLEYYGATHGDLLSEEQEATLRRNSTYGSRQHEYDEIKRRRAARKEGK